MIYLSKLTCLIMLMCLTLTPLMAVTEVIEETVSISKQTPVNFIYLSIDGVSRQSLYTLLKKRRLPHLQKIVQRGNFRNMEVLGHVSETYPSYTQMLTGYYSDCLDQEQQLQIPLPRGYTVFERLRAEFPSLKIVVIPSVPKNLDKPVTLSKVWKNASDAISLTKEEISRSADDVALSLIQSLDQVGDAPFFCFANFTNVEWAGHRYRADGEVYSREIKRADAAIGKLIRYLKKHQLWEKTHILLTTNYGFLPKSKQHARQDKSWVIYTKKVMFKGSQSDLIPTIYDAYKLPFQTWNPPLPGQPLIY